MHKYVIIIIIIIIRMPWLQYYKSEWKESKDLFIRYLHFVIEDLFDSGRASSITIDSAHHLVFMYGTS